MKRNLFAWLTLSSLLWASVALASPKTVVREFDGPNGKRLRGTVVAVLEDNSVTLVANDDADAEAKKQGVDLGSDSGRVAVGRELQVGVFIEGEVERKGARYQVVITAYGGEDGGKLGDVEVTATKANLPRAVRDKVWDALGAAIEGASAPQKAVEKEPEPVAAAAEEEEPEPEEAEEEEPAEESDEDDFVAEQSPLDLSVGARFGNRNFAYKDAFPGLRDYKLGFSPSLSLRAHWYPAAHVMNGVVANLGLDLRFDMLVGVTSKNSAGTEYSTSSTDLGVGLRFRVPLEKKDEIGVLLGYAGHSFGIEGNASGVPDVSHGSLRIGADARWAFMDPLSLYAQAAYLLSLSPGEIGGSAWFPNTSSGGVQAELGLGFGVIDSIELQLSFEIQRYFMSFDPKPTDAAVLANGRVAGGALDQYLSIRAGALFRM